VHAGGIDQPLGLLRMDYGMDFPTPTLIVPHVNWRGAYEMGTFAFGETSNCHGVWMPANEVVQHDSSGHMAYPAEASTADVYQDRCMEINFPGKQMGMTRLLNRPTVAGPIAWMGSLVQDAQDASGLMYRRNRYYDPISSRFTQEDPIGLAGGVNSYGFAEGDPVKYSDPYGLASDTIPQVVVANQVGKAAMALKGGRFDVTIPHGATKGLPIPKPSGTRITALGDVTVGVEPDVNGDTRVVLDKGNIIIELPAATKLSYRINEMQVNLGTGEFVAYGSARYRGISIPGTVSVGGNLHDGKYSVEYCHALYGCRSLAEGTFDPESGGR